MGVWKITPLGNVLKGGVIQKIFGMRVKKRVGSQIKQRCDRSQPNATTSQEEKIPLWAAPKRGVAFEMRGDREFVSACCRELMQCGQAQTERNSSEEKGSPLGALFSDGNWR